MGRGAWARRLLAVVVCGLAALGPPAKAEVVQLPSSLASAADRTMRVWFEPPPGTAAWATVILFPGGDGALDLRADGAFGSLRGNFLVRTRQNWLARGLAVLIPDVPAGLDHLRDQRASPAYATDIATMVRFARARAPAPVWLIGTSNGTIAAASGAARLTRGEIAGVVMSSSITRLGRQARQAETVYSTTLGDINVPALVVAHARDECFATPPDAAASLRDMLRNAPRREVMVFSGGLPARSGPCEAASAHGFLGIEEEVIGRIVAWMR